MESGDFLPLAGHACRLVLRYDADNPLFYNNCMAALRRSLLALLADGIGKKTPHSLTEAGEGDRVLFELVTEPAFLIEHASGIILDCNAAAASLIGATRESLLGCLQHELYPPDDRYNYEHWFTQRFAHGGVFPGLCAWHRDGFPIPVEIVTRPIILDRRAVVAVTWRDGRAQETPRQLDDALLDAVLETSDALVMVLDPDGRILRFNRACERFSGYRYDDVKGRRPWDLLSPPQHADAARQFFLEKFALSSCARQPWVSRTGEECIAFWRGRVVYDSGGTVGYIVATGTEAAGRGMETAPCAAFTEFERLTVPRALNVPPADEVPVRSETRLEEAQRAVQLGSWEWDIKSGRQFWSDEVFRLFGLESQNVLPNHRMFLDLIHPEDRASVQQALDDALTRRCAYSIDFRMLTPDSALRVIHGEGVASYDSAGKPQRMAGTLQDITERKAAEEALCRARDALEANVQERTAELRRANETLRFTQFVVDSAADAVFWMTTDDLRFVYVNEAACRCLGYSRCGLMALGFHGVSAESDAGARLASARGQGAITFESRFRRSSGSMLSVEITATALDFEGVEYYCLFARDITERRRAETVRQEQLMAARALSSISSRFVARDDIGRAIGEGLSELAALVDADRALLLGPGKEGLFPEFSGGVDGAPEMDFSFYAPLPSALAEGEVIVTRDPSSQAMRVLVPLIADQVLIGALAFEHARQVERWREGDFPLLRVAARVITAAVQRHRAEHQTTRLLEENRRLARESLQIQERERANLARELHDELGQCLTAIRADAQSIYRLSYGREPRIMASAEAIGDVASRVYEVVRNMMRRLRPEMLDELGLGEALREIVSQWRARHPEVLWDLILPDSLGSLPEAIQINAYRLVQESITNVVKHARASRVEVRVEYAPDKLTITVSDDGRGTDSLGHGGLGLLGMRERVLAAGGRFDISTAVGAGFRVTAAFPLADAGARKADVEKALFS